MHYVVGDVHGCFNEMMKMINQINEQDENAKFIFVGDFIDRGPDTLKVLNWCLENIKPNGKYQSVVGNHEYMVIEWYHTLFLNRLDEIPRTQYDFSMVVKENELDSEEKLYPYIKWMESLPVYIDLTINEKKYRIVHAWYPMDERNPSTWFCGWHRNSRGNFVDDTTIIHGHTPTISHPYDYGLNGDRIGKICYRPNSINIDGGCVFGTWYPNCHLCALCLETQEEFYIPN